jgi:protein gp37
MSGVPYFFKQWGEYLPVPVVNDQGFAGGRAFDHPRGGQVAASIRQTGGPFRAGNSRGVRAGGRNGHGVMLDDETIAIRLGKGRAGRLLDGRTWDEFPVPSEGGAAGG